MPKHPLVGSSTHLPEEHGTSRVELDRKGDRGEERRDENQPAKRERDVQHPLEQERRARELERGKPDQWQAFGGVDSEVRPDHLEEPGNDVDLDSEPRGACRISSERLFV